MRKYVKSFLCAGLASCMALGCAAISFAGTWRLGQKPNQSRWWYDFDNGSYAESGWQWIDGNNDGIAECYDFDKDGWMLADTRTPDGYMVNADGAWVENGVVQTKAAQQGQSQQEQSAGNQNSQSLPAQGTYFAGDYDASGNWVTNSSMITSDYWTDFWGFLVQTDGGLQTHSFTQIIVMWAQATARGAHWKAAFETYGLSYEVFENNIGYTSGSGGSFTFTTTTGISADALHDVEAVIGMLVNFRTDGMAQYEAVAVQGSSGEPATVTVTYQMGG